METASPAGGLKLGTSSTPMKLGHRRSSSFGNAQALEAAKNATGENTGNTSPSQDSFE
jgi:hypothetical protein